MKNSVKDGKYITYAHSAAVESGDMIQIGALVGVACGKYAANESGEYSLLGVYSFKKTGATVFAIGAAVEYDTATKEIVATGGAGDFAAGWVFEAAASGSTSVKVLLPLGGC